MTSCLALPSVTAATDTEESSPIALNVASVIWPIVEVAGSVWNSGDIIYCLAYLNLVMLEDAGFLAAVSLGPFVDTKLRFTWNDDNENWFRQFLDTNWNIFPATIGFSHLHNALVIGNAVISVYLRWLLELEAWLLIAAGSSSSLNLGRVDFECVMLTVVHADAMLVHTVAAVVTGAIRGDIPILTAALNGKAVIDTIVGGHVAFMAAT